MIAASLRRPADVGATGARRGTRREGRGPVLALLGALAAASAFAAAAPSLPFGSVVRLGAAEADAFLAGGWGDPETTHRWTVGPRAAVAFTLPREGPFVLRLTAHAHVGGAVRAQRMAAAVDGTMLSAWTLQDAAVRVKALAVREASGTAHTLTLDLPDAASPQAAGTGSDTRLLGLAVRALRADPFPAVDVGGAAVAWGGAAAEPFLGNGWAEPEDGARWTDGRRAEIVFALDAPGRADRVLELDAEPFVKKDVLPAQRVRFAFNDGPAGEAALARYGRRAVVIPLRASAQRRANLVALSLLDARSPASVRQGRDRRLLALRVHSIRFR